MRRSPEVWAPNSHAESVSTLSTRMVFNSTQLCRTFTVYLLSVAFLLDQFIFGFFSVFLLSQIIVMET